MLLMKKAFFDAIRRGAKTTTLRYWDRRRVRPGSVHLVPGLGLVRIDSVEVVAARRLRAADAKADGFAALGKLRAALREMYPPGERNGRRLFRITFTYLPAGRRGRSGDGPSLSARRSRPDADAAGAT